MRRYIFSPNPSPSAKEGTFNMCVMFLVCSVLDVNILIAFLYLYTSKYSRIMPKYVVLYEYF
jgi:hypothetical protein